MEKLILEAKTRDKSLNAKAVRDQGLIPAEYYGNGVKNQSLTVDLLAFNRVYKRAGGNTIVELDVDGGSKLTVLIHDVQKDPITGAITHIDFINVKMTEEIHTDIPLKFVGVSSAVKDYSGTLVTSLTSVEVRCLPKDLVHEIEVNIEALVDFNAYIRIKDLNVPAGIKIENDPEDVVATAVPPRQEEEEKPAEAAATAEAGAAAPEGEAQAPVAEK